MHGQKNIKLSILVLSVGSFFSYVNDARSHEPEACILFSERRSVYVFVVISTINNNHFPTQN